MVTRVDTIAAIATASGRGGIGVIRVSGPSARKVAEGILGRLPEVRRAMLAKFHEANGALLDQGIALFFTAPASYTGEDVLELQGHGGPVVLRELVRRCLELGARVAEPGEFTLRAFLNGRLDLAQAESVADLIDASSAEAVHGAARSMVGEFSARIESLVSAVTELRTHVEACIDFPEEEIDSADRAAQLHRLAVIREEVARVLDSAKQGALLREGLVVVLVGPPNVGKSSLLNRLAGEEVAIVTPVAGTTRDYVRATITIEGVPVHLIDTAGLRETADEVERIGIARTWEAIAKAGAAVLIVDALNGIGNEERCILARMPAALPIARVVNKIDLTTQAATRTAHGRDVPIYLSAKTGEGVSALRAWLLEVAGWNPCGEGIFIARRRHLEALQECAHALEVASQAHAQAYELFAEDLRVAQESLGRITGAVTADELLGQIFSRFCVGK